MEIKTKPKTFTYDVDVQWTEELKGRMDAEGKPPVEVATPPEFKGHPGIWSPEDLFVESVNVCTMVTFAGISRRRGVKFLGYRCRARGVLEMVDGAFKFTQITLEPVVTVAEEADVEPVRETLREAEAKCLIANSITARVQMNERVTVQSVVES